MTDAGGGTDGGVALGGGAQFVFAFGGAQLLLDGVQRGRGLAGAGVLPLHVVEFAGELLGRGVPRPRAGRGQLHLYGGEPLVRLGAPVLGLLVVLEGAFLGVAVDVSGDPAGRGGVFGGAADRAGGAVGEAGGEFGGDAGQPLFLEVEPVLPGGEGLFASGAGLFGGGLGVPGEPVAGAGGREAAGGRCRVAPRVPRRGSRPAERKRAVWRTTAALPGGRRGGAHPVHGGGEDGLSARSTPNCPDEGGLQVGRP
ncbi:hypothetical protein STENM223S_00292 [Streptomyces tendae]